MKEKFLVFSGYSVRTAMEGVKTQTRRVVKPQPPTSLCEYTGASSLEEAKRRYEMLYSPYGNTDRLWVKETFTYVTLAKNEMQDGDKWNTQLNCPVRLLYKADADIEGWELPAKWTSPRFMPRWASRLCLDIVNVRMEKLQDITQADAKAEGVGGYWKAEDGFIGTRYGGEYSYDNVPEDKRDFRRSYQELWDILNKKRGYGWDTNPWIYVIEFKKVLNDE